MTTHIDDVALQRYAVGHLGGSAAYSAEAHLIACDGCRRALAAKVEPARSDLVWIGVSHRLDDARRSVLDRLLTRAGLRDPLARIVVATPSAHVGWVVAVLVTLLGAMAASQLLGRGPLPFLLLAPVAPVLGVALSYGRGTDPVWEIAQAAPFGGFPLLLVRAATVLSVCTMTAAVLSVAFPEPGYLAVAWLLPSLALTVLTLALSTSRASLPVVAAAVCTGWVAAVVIAARVSADPLEAFGALGQCLAAAALVTNILFLVTRRDLLQRIGGPT